MNFTSRGHQAGKSWSKTEWFGMTYSVNIDLPPPPHIEIKTHNFYEKEQLIMLIIQGNMATQDIAQLLCDNCHNYVVFVNNNNFNSIPISRCCYLHMSIKNLRKIKNLYHSADGPEPEGGTLI